MLYDDRLTFRKQLILVKSKARAIYHYWYFLNKGLEFQSYICNRCDDILMMLLLF